MNDKRSKATVFLTSYRTQLLQETAELLEEGINTFRQAEVSEETINKWAKAAAAIRGLLKGRIR